MQVVSGDSNVRLQQRESGFVLKTALFCTHFVCFTHIHTTLQAGWAVDALLQPLLPAHRVWIRQQGGAAAAAWHYNQQGGECFVWGMMTFWRENAGLAAKGSSW